MSLFQNKCLQHFNDLLQSKSRINVSQGGTSCFSEKQNIITSIGVFPIKDIKPGDMVLSYNAALKIDEYKRVVSCVKQDNTKKCFRVKLKNGESIESTEDHLFFFNGRWVELNKIVNLHKSKKQQL